ncbi:MAG: hypothetical protein NC548_57375 [Lachnospiraceae bacterium]|nr:hypothetical protein [Lachnospiraceae bacterium]
MAKKTETTMEIQSIRKSTITLKLVGDTDLVLCKKARSYEREEIFRQSHPKGTKIPESLKQPYNLFEKLITSVTWENDIPQYDDYSEYTEEMWKEIVKTNRPCILSKAFVEMLAGTFKTFYKEATGRAGTDFKRSFNVNGWKNPVDFAAAEYDQHLTPTQGISHTNVLTQHNVFHGWSCDITVSFVDSIIPKETIIELINNAGSFLGIGSRTGDGYGRYHVESILEVG